MGILEKIKAEIAKRKENKKRKANYGSFRPSGICRDDEWLNAQKDLSEGSAYWFFDRWCDRLGEKPNLFSERTVQTIHIKFLKSFSMNDSWESKKFQEEKGKKFLRYILPDDKDYTKGSFFYGENKGKKYKDKEDFIWDIYEDYKEVGAHIYSQTKDIRHIFTPFYSASYWQLFNEEKTNFDLIKQMTECFFKENDDRYTIDTELEKGKVCIIPRSTLEKRELEKKKKEIEEMPPHMRSIMQEFESDNNDFNESDYHKKMIDEQRRHNEKMEKLEKERIEREKWAAWEAKNKADRERKRESEKRYERLREESKAHSAAIQRCARCANYGACGKGRNVVNCSSFRPKY